MVVDGNGNITWKTSSHKSTASVRFRTVGWNFQFSYKDAETGKIIDSPKDPVYVELSVFCKHFLDKIAKYFWTLLQNVFGHCCMSKLDKVAMPRLAA